jgi:hypothetical protein
MYSGIRAIKTVVQSKHMKAPLARGRATQFSTKSTFSPFMKEIILKIKFPRQKYPFLTVLLLIAFTEKLRIIKI